MLLKTENRIDQLDFQEGKKEEDTERPKLVLVWLSFFFSAGIIRQAYPVKNGRGQRAHHSRTHSYGDHCNFVLSFSLSLSMPIIISSFSLSNIL